MKELNRKRLANAPFFVFLALLNVVRFFALETSPPGFYVDEAAGAAQVMCLKQAGHDFFGRTFPLFSQGLGGGYYTAPYLYGQMFWTGIFGDSIASYRSFLALITSLSVVFLYLWLKRRTSARVAGFAALFASISPWVFQFSRIAWDPPLAPFFILLALFLLDLPGVWAEVLGALSMALAGYAYPPSRLQVGLLLLFLPGVHAFKKLRTGCIFLIALIPLFYRALVDPAFTVRAKMLALWSDYPMNPYRNDDFFGLLFDFVRQFIAHFSPRFLLLSGDANLRHSTQWFGLLSYPEAFVIIVGILSLIFHWRKVKLDFKASKTRFVLFLLLGLASGIAPAALTWESVPHALRSIGAWPFLISLTALLAGEWVKEKPKREMFIFASCGFFALFYFYIYFVDYPARAELWFQADASPLGSAYGKMIKQGISCSSLSRPEVR